MLHRSAQIDEVSATQMRKVLQWSKKRRRNDQRYSEKEMDETHKFGQKQNNTEAASI